MAAENIENCNSCDAAEKLAELPVLVLAKFSEGLVDMAKEKQEYLNYICLLLSWHRNS